VILHLSFEELSSLRSGTGRVLEADAHASAGIAAPPQVIADIEQLAPLLTGDITVSTLEQHRGLRAAVAHLLDESRLQMERAILEQHAAAESAIAAYFDYAHLLAVLRQLDRMRVEMAAVIQVLTGNDPDSEAARRFCFPD
jgi:FMN phosphatase YigB (HAD superfamily)